MASYRVTTAVIGFFVAVCILFLVGKDRIHVRYSLWWLVLSVVSILIGSFPGIVDVVAHWLGVHYPPTLFFSFAVAAFLLKILRMDIELSRQEKEITRLLQRIAILEKRDRDEPDGRA